MKRINQNLLADISLEMTPLTENNEGQLRGGFAGLGGETSILSPENPYTNCRCKNGSKCNNDPCTNMACENDGCTNGDCTNVTTTTTTTKIIILGGNIGLLI